MRVTDSAGFHSELWSPSPYDFGGYARGTVARKQPRHRPGFYHPPRQAADSGYRYPGMGGAPPVRVPAGYVLEWSPSMGGLGKFKLKKITKVFSKALKAVAPIASTFIPGIGPVIGPVVAAGLNRSKASQAQDYGRAVQQGQAWAQHIATQPGPSQAAAQDAVQRYAAQTGAPIPNFAPPQEFDESGRPIVQSTSSGFPGWAIPAALGGVALMLLLTRGGK